MEILKYVINLLQKVQQNLLLLLNFYGMDQYKFVLMSLFQCQKSSEFNKIIKQRDKNTSKLQEQVLSSSLDPPFL